MYEIFVIYYFIYIILYYSLKDILSCLLYNSQRKYLEHHNKHNIPLIGGILVIISLLYYYNHILYISLLLYGLIGLIDDILKQNKSYLNFYYKIILQLISYMLIIQYISPSNEINLIICTISCPMIIKYIFCYFVISGTANGVNLSDGLDSLAGKCILNLATVLGIIAIMQGQDNIAKILFALSGAILGFLTFNLYPARIFMGDTGALGIGAMLAVASIMLNCEVMIIISGIYFFLASMSVIIQTIYFKLYKTRFFTMAPIHHGFEKLGYHEVTIVETINIISIVSSFIALYLYYYFQ